jgi:hypothetical protein
MSFQADCPPLRYHRPSSSNGRQGNVMARQYTTKPFNPSVKEKQATGDEIARQLADLINEGATNGWTFDSYQSVQTTVNPGCLGAFSGPRIVQYGIVVFYREA